MKAIIELIFAVLILPVILTAMPAYAQATTYIITAGSDTTGTISPSGAVNVNAGANQTFIITPGAGYDMNSISIDNYIQATPLPTATANVFQYSFQNVNTTHIIYASFYPSSAAAGAPQVTGQPQSVSILTGATATFTVSATGATNYQWYESTNGGVTFTAIGGANAVSYTTPAATNADNGTEFVCEVFNGNAFVSTNMATFTLLPYVKVQGRQLMVWNNSDQKYEPYVIRGVDYNPTPIGRYSSDWGYYVSATDPNPNNLPNNIFADPNILNRDFPLIQGMNANTIRIWGGDNTMETGRNQPVSESSFENAFPLQDPSYGDDIYSWLLENNYVNGAGYINVDLTSSTFLLALQSTFTDPGEYYTILDVLRTAYYGDANPGRFPNMITPSFLAAAGSNGLKVIVGFWVNPFGSCNYTTGSCVYTLNNYNGESNDPSLNVPFDITNAYIANDILMRFEVFVNTFKNDPNILFWAIGNENNLSLNPNNPAQIKAWYKLVNQMAAAAHAIEGANFHPVAVVNGDDGFKYLGNPSYSADDNSLTNVDIWGINTYRGQSFYDFFFQYKSLSQKPLWISEYGVDSWHSCTADDPAISGCDANDPSAPAAAFAPAYPYQPANDEADQATWDGDLWDEIAGNGDITVGGSVMEYSDVWWQPNDWICNNLPYSSYGDATFCHWNHFYFGEGPGSYWPSKYSTFVPAAPDHYDNEAWWGLMGISNPSPETQADTMNPRQAYYTFQGRFASNGALPSYLVSPLKGTTLNSTSIPFAWSLGRGATQYQLLVGTTSGEGNVFTYTGTATSTTVTGIPLTGQMLYVQLGSEINGAWQYNNYTYATVQLTPYEQWQAQNFTPAQLANPGISGNAAAPAGDGIPNLFKYAFNLNPFTAYTSAFQYYLLNDHFTIVYRQNLNATDLTIQIGATDSLLGPWGYNAFTLADQSIDANTQLVTATDSVNSTTVTSRFYRFVLTLQGGQSMMASLSANPNNAYFSITASAGTGGSISPSGSVNVKTNAGQTFTATPNAYNILNPLWDIDGVSTSVSGNSYTFSSVTAAHTIQANFIPYVSAMSPDPSQPLKTSTVTFSWNKGSWNSFGLKVVNSNGLVLYNRVGSSTPSFTVPNIPITGQPIKVYATVCPFGPAKYGNMGPLYTEEFDYNTMTTLTLRLIGNGAGQFTSAPVGINCVESLRTPIQSIYGGTCTAEFPVRTTVKLTDVLAKRSRLVTWGVSNCNPASNTCSIPMNQSKTIDILIEGNNSTILNSASNNAS